MLWNLLTSLQVNYISLNTVCQELQNKYLGNYIYHHYWLHVKEIKSVLLVKPLQDNSSKYLYLPQSY